MTPQQMKDKTEKAIAAIRAHHARTSEMFYRAGDTSSIEHDGIIGGRWCFDMDVEKLVARNPANWHNNLKSSQ